MRRYAIELCILVVSVLLPSFAWSQSSTLKSGSNYGTLESTGISPDGAWIVAEQYLENGEGKNVQVWSTSGGMTFTIERAIDPRVSRDSRWVCALQAPKSPESESGKTQNHATVRTLVLLNLHDGSFRKFENVLTYDFAFTCSYLYYLASTETQSDQSGDSNNGLTTTDNQKARLHWVHLNDGHSGNIENVAKFVPHLSNANHGTNDHFAHVLQKEQTGRDRLYMNLLNPGRDGLGNWGTRGIHDGHDIKSIGWARDHAIAVFVDQRKVELDGSQETSTTMHTWHDVPGLASPRGFTKIRTNDPETNVLQNPIISSDGAWIAVEEVSNSGEGNIRVWSLRDDKHFTIEHAHSPRFSEDSKWVSAFEKPRSVKTDVPNPALSNEGQTLVLVNTRDGSRRTFDSVLSYEVTHFSSHLAYLQAPKRDNDGLDVTDDTDFTAQKRALGTLNVVELKGNNDRTFTWQNVTESACHQATGEEARGTWKEGYAYVAFVSRDEENENDRLEVAFLGHDKRAWGTGGIYKGKQIGGLCWATDSIVLGFFDRSEKSAKNKKSQTNNVVYSWHDIRDRRGHRNFTPVSK